MPFIAIVFCCILVNQCFHLIHPVSTRIWPLPKLIQCLCQRFLCCVIPPASRNALHPLWPVQPVVRGRRVLRDTSWYGGGNLGILRLNQLRMGYVFSDRQRRRWAQMGCWIFRGPPCDSWKCWIVGNGTQDDSCLFPMSRGCNMKVS